MTERRGTKTNKQGQGDKNHPDREDGDKDNQTGRMGTKTTILVETDKQTGEGDVTTREVWTKRTRHLGTKSTRQEAQIQPDREERTKTNTHGGGG